MTNHNNKSISNWQMAMLVFLIPFIFKMAMLPSLLATHMKNDIYIGAFIMLLLEFLQLFFIIKFLQWGGVKKLKEKIGEKLYRLLIIPIWFIFFIKILLMLQSTTSYIATFLFYNIKNINIMATVLIISIYLGIKGGRSFGRIGEIVIFVVPIIFILGLSFGKVKLRSEYLLPIMTNGLGPIFEGVQLHMTWTFGFTPFLFFEYKKTKNKPFVLISSISSIVFVTFCFMAVVINYGPSAHLVDFAFARLAAFNVVSTEIGSIDLPTITLWLIMAVVIIGINFYSSGMITSEFKINKRYSLPIMGVIAFIVCSYVLINLETTIDLVKGFLRIPMFIIEFLMPILFLILVKVKKVGEKESYEKRL